MNEPLLVPGTTEEEVHLNYEPVGSQDIMLANNIQEPILEHNEEYKETPKNYITVHDENIMESPQHSRESDFDEQEVVQFNAEEVENRYEKTPQFKH